MEKKILKDLHPTGLTPAVLRRYNKKIAEEYKREGLWEKAVEFLKAAGEEINEETLKAWAKNYTNDPSRRFVALEIYKSLRDTEGLRKLGYIFLEDAEPYYENSLAAEPEKMNRYWCIGEGQYYAATVALENAKQCFILSQDQEGLKKVAELHIKRGEYWTAWKVLEAGGGLVINSAEFYAEMVKNFMARGDTERAAIALRRKKSLET